MSECLTLNIKCAVNWSAATDAIAVSLICRNNLRGRDQTERKTKGWWLFYLHVFFNVTINYSFLFFVSYG